MAARPAVCVWQCWRGVLELARTPGGFPEGTERGRGAPGAADIRKTLGMKRFIAFLGTVFAALHCVAAQDAEVERAETELRTATTQADMNDAARKLSHLWDVRLRAVEARI